MAICNERSKMILSCPQHYYALSVEIILRLNVVHFYRWKKTFDWSDRLFNYVSIHLNVLSTFLHIRLNGLGNRFMTWGNCLIILLIRLNGFSNRLRNRLNVFEGRFLSVCIPFFQAVKRISVSVRFPKSGHKLEMASTRYKIFQTYDVVGNGIKE